MHKSIMFLQVIILFVKAVEFLFVYIGNMNLDEKKKLVLKSLAKCTRNLRDDKSQFMFCSENDISTSIISTIERGIKDPQLTTIFKIAEAFGMKPSKFVKMIEDNLPNDFSLIDF